MTAARAVREIRESNVGISMGRSITAKQLVFMFLGSVIGVCGLSIPREVDSALGQNGWMAVLAGALVPLISIVMIDRLYRHSPEGLDFVDLNRRLLGKYLGTVMVSLSIVYFIIIQSVVIRMFAEVTRVYMLPATPIWVTLLLISYAVYSVISKGSRVVARINELVFYLLLLTLFFGFLPLPHGDLTNLLPVGEVGTVPLLKGMVNSAYAFEGLEILLVLYTLVEQREKILKAGMIALGVGLAIYLYITLICTLLFGPYLIKSLFWPTIYYFKTITFTSAPRMELVILTFWMGLGARPAVTLGFTASLSLGQLFKIQKEQNYKLIVLLVVIVMYLLALIPHNIFDAMEYVVYVGMISVVFSLGYPGLLLLAAILRGGRHGE